MLTLILLGTVLFQHLLFLDAQRPKYRLDYRYEKAFNNFYKLHAAATTWQEARIRCQAEGTELLVPDTLDEADAVPMIVTPILNKFQGIFVGIHDLYSERSFVTIRVESGVFARAYVCHLNHERDALSAVLVTTARSALMISGIVDAPVDAKKDGSNYVLIILGKHCICSGKRSVCESICVSFESRERCAFCSASHHSKECADDLRNCRCSCRCQKGEEIKNSILNLLWEYKQPLYGEGRCVAMRRTGRTFVQPCDKPLPFICKIAGSKIEFYKECNTYEKNWILGPNSTCYFMHVEPQTWSQAYATCLSAGGQLAILNNQSEADHLKTMFKRHEPRRMPKDDFAFLGYSDLFQRHHYRTVEGDLVVDLGYKEWEIGCPEPYVAESPLRCGGMRRHGLLAIGDCNIPSMFFCEKPANDTVAKDILRSTNARSIVHEHGPKHAEHDDTSLLK